MRSHSPYTYTPQETVSRTVRLYTAFYLVNIRGWRLAWDSTTRVSRDLRVTYGEREPDAVYKLDNKN